MKQKHKTYIVKVSKTFHATYELPAASAKHAAAMVRSNVHVMDSKTGILVPLKRLIEHGCDGLKVDSIKSKNENTKQKRKR
jgi:hypothetical protein